MADNHKFDRDNNHEPQRWITINAPHEKEKDEGMKLWSIAIFSLIGATATTFALKARHIWQVLQLRRTADWASAEWLKKHSWKGGSSSFRSSFQEEARRRYRQRMQEEYEEEMERVERIRRMQNVFNRERNKYKRGYESWRENESGAYHQHFQREDWYWTSDTSFRDRHTNYRHTNYNRQAPQQSGGYSLSRHYAVLGLDRLRTNPYTDEEIKSAFRAKALEFHPDQNQDNKEAAEAKFKEVLTSYEAIKSERKNMKL